MSSKKYHAIVHGEGLESFDSGEGVLHHQLCQLLFNKIKDTDNFAPFIPPGSKVAQVYGEWKAEGIKAYLKDNFSFNLNSLQFEDFVPSPDNPNIFGIRVSMDRGDLHLLEHFVNPDEIQTAINCEIKPNDLHGFYQSCPTTVGQWRNKTPEMRSDEERGMLLNAATEFSWHTDISIHSLGDKLSKVELPIEVRVLLADKVEYRSPDTSLEPS